MRRSLPVVAAMAVVVALLASCSSVGPQPAATVNGVRISDDALRAELKEMNKDPRFLAGFESDFGSPLPGKSKGTFSRQFMTSLLFLRVEYLLVEQQLARSGNLISPSDLEDSFQQLRGSFGQVAGGKDLFDGFSDAYRDRLVRDNAVRTVAEQVAGESLGSAREYYDTHQRDFRETCVSHILVGSNHADAEARADALKQRLADGADFGDLASTESDDPQSADQDGHVGCLPPGRLVAEFQQAMDAAPIGEVVGPVKSEFGYHLIVVQSRSLPPFDKVQAQAEQAVASAKSGSLESLLLDALCGSGDVHVSSRYGRWDRSGCEGGQGATIEPPTGPTTTAAG